MGLDPPPGEQSRPRCGGHGRSPRGQRSSPGSGGALFGAARARRPAAALARRGEQNTESRALNLDEHRNGAVGRTLLCDSLASSARRLRPTTSIATPMFRQCTFFPKKKAGGNSKGEICASVSAEHRSTLTEHPGFVEVAQKRGPKGDRMRPKSGRAWANVGNQLGSVRSSLSKPRALVARLRAISSGPVPSSARHGPDSAGFT